VIAALPVVREGHNFTCGKRRLTTLFGHLARLKVRLVVESGKKPSTPSLFAFKYGKCGD
jgi:hypothetical protein